MQKKKGLKGSRMGRPPLLEEGLKIVIARDYLEGQQSYGQLGVKYNQAADTIRWAVKWYREYTKRQPLVESVAEAGDETEQALRLKITALEMLIQNAEKEFGIEIIKKSGTKQQGK